MGGNNGSVDGVINTPAVHTLSYSGYVPYVRKPENNSATGINGGGANGFSNISNFVGSANWNWLGRTRNQLTFSNGSPGPSQWIEQPILQRHF